MTQTEWKPASSAATARSATASNRSVSATPREKLGSCKPKVVMAFDCTSARVQKERFTDLDQYDHVKDLYRISPEIMSQAREKMVVMHPLPRVTEIDPAVDEDPRAAYFRQMQNGMFLRMALLAAVLGAA